jgi:hypothetical protein
VKIKQHRLFFVFVVVVIVGVLFSSMEWWLKALILFGQAMSIREVLTREKSR